MDFEKLLKRLNPKLIAISKKVRNKYSYCDENDFYQEAILHLWVMFQTGEFQEKTDSYILQGCYYFLKNYVRKICKSVDVGSVSLYGEMGDKENETTLNDTIVSQTYIDEINSIEIYMLLADVKEKFNNRETDVFYYQLEGFTTREIGRMIGVSHVMVGKVEKKIRKKCQRIKEACMS